MAIKVRQLHIVTTLIIATLFLKYLPIYHFVIYFCILCNFFKIHLKILVSSVSWNAIGVSSDEIHSRDTEILCPCLSGSVFKAGPLLFTSLTHAFLTKKDYIKTRDELTVLLIFYCSSAFCILHSAPIFYLFPFILNIYSIRKPLFSS